MVVTGLNEDTVFGPLADQLNGDFKCSSEKHLLKSANPGVPKLLDC